jgi:hypothetical protein
MIEKSHQHALPDGHTLHWYRTQRVLGQGAFGITYLALDVNLDRLVAIKEYMPTQLAARGGDFTVRPLSDEHREDFQWGLTRFVDEARTLTRFEHPNLVRVLNVFELHGTAYMVMNYEQGESLAQVLKREKTLPEARLLQILLPLMNGLELIHARGFVHRDIKPGNIFIRQDGSPVLLDFGSARQTRGHADPQTLTTLVSPGYAPIEQYTSKSDRQGPWTDIYGLAATIYRAVAGIPPSSATDRSALFTQGMHDDLQPLASLVPGRYSETFLAAIDHALAFRVEERPQNIAEWRREFAVDDSEIDTQPGRAAWGADAVTERIADVPATAVAPSVERGAASRAVDPEAKTEPIVPAAITEMPVSPVTPPVMVRHRRFPYRGLAIAALIVLALVAWRIGRRADAPAPAPAVAHGVTPGVSAGYEAAPAVNAGAVPVADARRIEELLVLAEADLAALRLMSPKGNNAYERFQEVLTLDPGNDAATRGIDDIARRYVRMAHGAMANGRLDDAAVYLIRAGRIAPDTEGLKETKLALSARFAAARRANRDARTAPAARGSAVPVEKRETPSDRVRKSLGER